MAGEGAVLERSKQGVGFGQRGAVDGFEGLDCLTAAGEGLLERDWWDRIEQALEFFHVTRIPQIGNRKQLQEVREVNRRDGRLRRQNLRTVSANRKGERNQLDGTGVVAENYDRKFASPLKRKNRL